MPYPIEIAKPDPDAPALHDCHCGHRFLDHQLNGRERLADSCKHSACGCLVYRPTSIPDPTEETT